MADTQEKLTLDQLPVGGSCILCQVGNQRGAVKRRLIDMGLTPGTEVKLVKIAPFGDPLELRLRGYELSLRKEDAAQIRIRPLEEKEAGKQAVPETAYHLGGGCHGDTFSHDRAHDPGNGLLHHFIIILLSLFYLFVKPAHASSLIVGNQ